MSLFPEFRRRNTTTTTTTFYSRTDIDASLVLPQLVQLESSTITITHSIPIEDDVDIELKEDEEEYKLQQHAYSEMKALERDHTDACNNPNQWVNYISHHSFLEEWQDPYLYNIQRTVSTLLSRPHETEHKLVCDRVWEIWLAVHQAPVFYTHEMAYYTKYNIVFHTMVVLYEMKGIDGYSIPVFPQHVYETKSFYSPDINNRPLFTYPFIKHDAYVARHLSSKTQLQKQLIQIKTKESIPYFALPQKRTKRKTTSSTSSKYHPTSMHPFPDGASALKNQLFNRSFSDHKMILLYSLFDHTRIKHHPVKYSGSIA